MSAESSALADALADFGRSASGAGLPDDVAAWIEAAGRLRDRPDDAYALLERARDAAPTHPAPLIALYRFHFYAHQLAQARAVGEAALALVRSALGTRFGNVPPGSDAVRDDVAVRFHLFVLKGLAYLNLRLGDADAARAQLNELRRLDPDDRIGGALLMHVLMRHERSVDLVDEDELLRAHPARGWGELAEAGR